jgi:hypothetical protein
MLKAYSIGEKAKAATSTPLPKAIMVAIIDFGSLANNATTEPKRRGILATKPHTKACNTVFVTKSFIFLLIFYYICYQVIIINRSSRIFLKVLLKHMVKGHGVKITMMVKVLPFHLAHL